MVGGALSRKKTVIQMAENSSKQALLHHLKSYITPERWGKFEKIVACRTRHLTLVLEDIYQSQNASAVLRSCDLTGIQDVHIIENRNEYNINPDVSLGADKWLNINRYNRQTDNTDQALRSLKNQGYIVVAASPHEKGFTPDTLPLDQPLALLFGTEKEGLSQAALKQADAFVRIPMYGFSESFNISVSAAILLYKLSQRLHASDIAWQLTAEEQLETLLGWCRNTIKRADLIEKQFNATI